MPAYGQFYYGMAYYGVDGPVLTIGSGLDPGTPIEGAVAPADPYLDRALDVAVTHLLLDVNGVPISDQDSDPPGAVIVSGTTTEEEGVIPRLSGRLRLADVDGTLAATILKGTILIPVKRMTYSDGRSYDLGPGRVGVVAPARAAESRPDSYDQSFEVEVIQQASIDLQFSVEGDLVAQAYTVSFQTGLLGPDGTASVEGIMAWLLVQGGASAVGIEGVIRPTPSFTAQFGAVKISPFVLARELTAAEVMAELVDHTGVYYWIDWDGTAVLKASPRSVLDIAQKAPVRIFRESDENSKVINRIVPSPGITPEQFKLINQSSTGVVRNVSYVVPIGSGMPVARSAAGPLRSGQFKRFDSSIFAPPALDPNDKQDERARQLALLESLRANEIELSIIPDPGLRAGQTVILDYRTYGASNELYWVKRKVEDWGEGDDVITCQRLFTPDQLGAGTVGDTPYTWATQVPRFAVVTWYPFIFVGALGPYRPDVYNYTPSTFEGWIKLKSWPQKSGANVPAALFHTPNALVYLSGGVAGTNASVTVRLYNDAAALVVSLPSFTQSVSDNAWHHWALQREADWSGIWIDGVLKASAGGSFGVTAPVIGHFADHLGYNNCGFMRADTALAGDPTVTPDVQGEFALYSWRFSRRAVYPHSNFTPLTTDFRANGFADYPTVASVWPFLALQERLLNPSDTQKQVVAWSSTSDMYATVSGLKYAAGGEDPPFA